MNGGNFDHPSQSEITLTQLPQAIEVYKFTSNRVMGSKYQVSLKSKRLRSKTAFHCWGNEAGLLFLPWPKVVDPYRFSINIHVHIERWHICVKIFYSLHTCLSWLQSIYCCLSFMEQPSNSCIDWLCWTNRKEWNWLVHVLTITDSCSIKLCVKLYLCMYEESKTPYIVTLPRERGM
jgi:hypothetical protein